VYFRPTAWLVYSTIDELPSEVKLPLFRCTKGIFQDKTNWLKIKTDNDEMYHKNTKL